MFDENKPKLHKVIRILQILGGSLFVAAYILPGISLSDEAKGLIGYKCASSALTFGIIGISGVIRGKESWKEIWIPILVGVSGLNNLLVPVYVLIKKARRRPLVLAIIVSCVATPCAVLFGVNEHPVIGCYLWMLGTILLLAPETICLLERRGQ